MKKTFNISIIIRYIISFFLFFSLFSFMSCEKSLVDDIEPTTESKAKYKVFSLHLNEEHFSINEVRMFSALSPQASSAVKLYAINVYEKTPKAKSYAKYAYGLFTDPSAISIELKEGNLYRFECLVVTQDKDSIYHENGKYFAPFLHGSKKDATMADNKFKKSTSANFVGLTEGTTQVSANETTLYPKLYKSYGVLEDFDPLTESALTISTKSAVFGLRFIVSPPTDGVVVVNYLNRSFEVSSAQDAYDVMSVYSFNQISKAIAEDYSGNITIEATWRRSNGYETVSRKQIPVKRKVITEISIDMKEPTASNVSISEEDQQMSTEQVRWIIE